MARYKVVDRNPRFLPVILDAQLMVGSFEYALRKEFCIHTIGLATLTDAFRIMANVLGIEHKHDEAELVGKVGKQFVIDAGGFHADATAFRQALEKGPQRGALIRVAILCHGINQNSILANLETVSESRTSSHQTVAISVRLSA